MKQSPLGPIPRHCLGRLLATLVVPVLVGTSPGLAQPTAGHPHNGGPDASANHRANLREEQTLARLLARLDEELALGTFPDATPHWLARLAARIEAQEDAQPARELLRRLAVELRGLGVEWSLGGERDVRAPGRPRAGSPAGRERADRIRRIRSLVELLQRKLRSPQEVGTGAMPGRMGPIHSAIGDSDGFRPISPKYGSDTCEAAFALALGQTNGETFGAGSDGAASCGGPSPSPDVWYVFTAPHDGTYTFRTIEPPYVHYTSYDTVLSLHSACPLSGGDAFELACSDDVGATLLSSISYPLTAGQAVRVRVSGYGGASGDFTLRVTLDRTIRGTLTWSGTGGPVSGAAVEVLDIYGDVLADANSGSDGSYAVPVAAIQQLYLRVRDDRLVTELYDDHECPFGTYCPTHFADAIQVEAADASGIDFVLRRGSTLSGSITAADTGEPPSGGTYLELYESDGSAVGSVYSEVGSHRYTISSLLPGTYYLRASASGYRAEVWSDVGCPYPCDPTSGAAIVVTEGDEVTGIDFVLDRLGKIQGEVTRAGDAGPVEFQEVIAYDDGGTAMGSDYTASDGRYQVDGLPEGTYFVRTATTYYIDELYDDHPCEPECDVTIGMPVAVPANATVSGIDFSLLSKASIRGTVTDSDSGEPLDVDVYLYDDSGVFLRQDSTRTPPGVFEFRGLDAGTYYLRAGYSYRSSSSTHVGELYEDLPCAVDCDVTAGTPVTTTTSSELTGIDFALHRRGWIAGTVTDASTGLPIRSAYVYAFELDGTYVDSDSTADDGSYEIRNLLAGSYRVRATSNRHQDEMYDDVPCGDPCDKTTGLPVTVQSRTGTSNVDLALTPYGKLSGTVVDSSSGDPLTSDLYLLSPAGAVVQSSETSLSSFYFDGVRPGTFYLLARESRFEVRHQDELYPNVPCEPDCDLTEGTPITIGLGSVLTGYDFALAPCPVASREALVSTTITTTYKALACEELTAGDLLLGPGADVLLKSGRSVVLGDGFRMEPGARLRVVIEPAWSAED